MYIFTYGTLQRGESRGDILPMFGCRYKGLAKILGMKLYHYPFGQFPIVFTTGNENNEVIGEVYFIEDERFVETGLASILSQIEGEGVMYKVSNKDAIMLDTGEVYNVSVYEGIAGFWKYGENCFVKKEYGCVNVTEMGQWKSYKYE